MALTGLIVVISILVLGESIKLLAKFVTNKKIKQLQQELDEYKAKNGGYPKEYQFRKKSETWKYEKTAAGYRLYLPAPDGKVLDERSFTD